MTYSFEQHDQQINELHYHPVMEIGVCHAGSGIFVVEDKCFAFRQDDIFIINSSEYHLAQSHRGTSSQWTFLHFDVPAFIGELPLQRILDLNGPQFRNQFSSSEQLHLRHTIDVIIDELHDQATDWQALVRSSLQQLLILLSRLPLESGSHTQHNMQPIAPAISLMSNSYADDLSNEQLAAACYMSEVHFRRQFKRCTGQTPHHYLNKIRIHMACSLLAQSDLSVLQIAIECGYSTLSTFNRQFKQQTGVTPREQRNKSVYECALTSSGPERKVSIP